jgi:hypothetical protein
MSTAQERAQAVVDGIDCREMREAEKRDLVTAIAAEIEGEREACAKVALDMTCLRSGSPDRNSHDRVMDRAEQNERIAESIRTRATTGGERDG